MKNLLLYIRVLIAFVLIGMFTGAAWAQSSPGLFNGQVPTAAQWNSYFAKKADWPIGGFCADGSVFANLTGTTNSLRCTPASSLPAGSAASAAKWTTPRTFTFTGAATGSGVVDGSADVTFNLTGAGGSVTSVGLSMPATYSCTGSPVTSSGTITCGYVSQGANKFLASPDGATGTPSYRPIVNADLPATGVTAGSYTAANITVNAQGVVTAASNGTAGGAFASASLGGVNTYTFTVPSGSNILEICGQVKSSSTSVASDLLNIQFNGDTSAHYLYSRIFSNTSSGSGVSGGGPLTAMQVDMAASQASTISTDASSFCFTLPNYAGTSFMKRAHAWAEVTNSSGPTYYDIQYGLSWYLGTPTNAVTSVTISTNSGSNFAAGSTAWGYVK